MTDVLGREVNLEILQVKWSSLGCPQTRRGGHLPLCLCQTCPPETATMLHMFRAELSHACKADRSK